MQNYLGCYFCRLMLHCCLPCTVSGANVTEKNAITLFIWEYHICERNIKTQILILSLFYIPWLHDFRVNLIKNFGFILPMLPWNLNWVGCPVPIWITHNFCVKLVCVDILSKLLPRNHRGSIALLSSPKNKKGMLHYRPLTGGLSSY